ncbi:Swi/snf and rsc complexes subunit ssr2, partial [Globisporangium splendens]
MSTSPAAPSSAPAAASTLSSEATAAAPASPAAVSPVPSHASSPPQEQQLSARQGDAPSQDPVEKSVVVPRCSTWFAMDAINPIEKRMLPEFFVNEALYRNFPPGAKSNASKTPQIYLKYRNFMINAYRQQPQVYLTATACRRNLAGDACAILRVHEFLTHWGLINYSVPPHAMPPSIHPNYSLKPAVSTSSSASLASSSGPIAVLHEIEKQGMRRSGDKWNWKCEACALGEIQFELAPDAKKKVVEILNNGNAGPGINSSNANGAAGVKEMAVGAFCVAPGTGLCDDCYLSRACFPEGIDAADFVRVEKRPQWTQEETTVLLDAVASSGKDSDESCDWNTIAAKVRSKTAEECMLHFLELPILQRAAGVDLTGASASSSSNAADVLQRPFVYAQAMNASVLDMSALVSQVDPFVAKAAAHAAIRAVQQLHTMPVARAATPSVNESIKAEPAAGLATSSSSEAAQANGDLGSSLEQAAAAVVSSGQAAGISVKSEGGVDGDVEMKDTETTEGGAVATKSPAPLSKEVIAVAKEAANGTAAALLAVRAHTIADATARGPVRDLVTQLLENQLQQMELKLQQVSVLEKTLAAEKEALAHERYQLYVDRLAFAQEKLGAGGGGL